MIHIIFDKNFVVVLAAIAIVVGVFLPTDGAEEVTYQIQNMQSSFWVMAPAVVGMVALLAIGLILSSFANEAGGTATLSALVLLIP